ncbi:hypothetical protein O9H32_08155 [Paenibacillus mucilaginosus]|nr:hypothetical protein [Paenibacillus caseinilyticus]
MLVARNEDKLAELAKEYRESCRVQVTVFAKDLALPGMTRAFRSAQGKVER